MKNHKISIHFYSALIASLILILESTIIKAIWSVELLDEIYPYLGIQLVVNAVIVMLNPLFRRLKKLIFLIYPQNLLKSIIFIRYPE